MPAAPPPAQPPQQQARRVAAPAPTPTPPPPPSGFGELSLEDLTRLPLPESPGAPGDLHAALEMAASEPETTPIEQSLEAPSFAPEPAQEAEAAVPEGLTLEGLLLTEAAAAPAAPEPQAAAGEESVEGPVFDLTSEMEGPSLPMVEVGTGEPPALSIEDLLVPNETAPPDAEAAGAQGLELELTPDSSLEETPVTAPPLELEGLTASPEEPPPPEPAPPAAAPSPGGAGALPDAAAMRQLVTERVARELAVDLSDKLLERIERIVWDVVPELAEILIAKEIEKIRAVAEGKEPS